MNIPANIVKEHILKAIHEIDAKGIRKGRESKNYDLVYEEKTYPPKLVLSIANRYANGNELDPHLFVPGKDSQAFKLLENEGFVIIEKLDPVKSLIENYKKHITKTGLDDEIYKWKLLNEFKGRPDTNAVDFYQEIKSIKFQNLIYQLAAAVLNLLAKGRAEELRSLFKFLFDETKNLTRRIKFFNEETLKLYRAIGGKLQHHQDERSIATYLTFHDPSKYTFYKSSFYKKYCKLLGIEEAKTSEKYVHYLVLIDQLIEDYIKPDLELIILVKSLLPDYYDGENHKLLAQDILFQMLDREETPNYWVFQGNPNFFDVVSALNDNVLTTWSVKAHKDKIKEGDKIILWLTGNHPGCYAFGEVTSEVYEGIDEEEQLKYYSAYSKNEMASRVRIMITKNLASNPIKGELLSNVAELANLKVGNQGTNFSATEEEYNALLKLIEIPFDDFQSTLNQFSADDLSKYFTFLKEIIDEFKLLKGDQRLVFSIREKQLNFTIGQRYCFNLFASEHNGKFGVISKHKLLTESSSYDGTPPQPFYSYYNEFNPTSHDKESVFEAINSELNRTKKSSFRKYNNPDFETYVFANQIQPIPEKMKLSLNTILYGPPGTGKTYVLKNYYMPLFTSAENAISRDEFLKDVIQNCSWWQVIALALLELGKTKVAGIFNHELVQIKAQLSNSTTVAPTIWGTLQSHTIEECEYVHVQKRMPPFIFNKTKKSEWEIIPTEVEEQAPELIELKTKIDGFSKSQNIKIERFEFLTFHQSYSYEDFIEGIKPELSESEVAYKIEEGVFQKMCNRARNDLSRKYAIFIDEINRGNISSIFGELITLIEDDKREGKSNQIKATLPYSKKLFSVPDNLYIIGTMNTADRSVEALDTALRRRFSFIEMNPEPEKLNQPEFMCKGIDLEKLLKAINGRIEKLLDKDYCIGHSYFMTIQDRENPLEDLRSIFQNKILPLLQEYFYGDWGKIVLVVGKEFVYKKADTIKFLSNEFNDDYEEYNEKPIYRFVDSNTWSIDSFKSIYEY